MAVVFVLLGASGCATHEPPGKQSSPEAEQLAALEQRLALVERDLKAVRSRNGELRARLEKIERTLSLQQAQLAGLSDALERRREHSSRSGPERHPGKPVAASGPLPTTEPASVSSTQGPMLEQRVDSGEKDAYTKAYLALKSGKYAEAIQGFEAFLQAFPDGEYADQAWFWLGESHYAEKQVEKAIRDFRTVAEKHPDSVKHPAALLRLGQILQLRGRNREARRYYERLIREHPDTPAADQARSALRALEQAREAKP